jgi:phenylpropionate dioxygenase-like ring-hydroxylating dioxygenase large terminal subunit
MTNLASVERIVASQPQLPAAWYFDEKVLEVEKRVLFDDGPDYVGHELMVPEQRDYRVLERYGNAWALIRKSGGIELVSNVCRHRQAIMLRDHGRLENANIVCPLHRWTYGLDGKLLGAPHFPSNPCLNLPKRALQNWNGMLFRGERNIPRDLGRLGVVKDLDFSGYLLDKVEVTEYDFNWKTFIEVYLEDYHVAPFHPGLSNFVDCNRLEWEFGDWYSVQVVGVSKGLNRPGTETYREWHDALKSYRGGEDPRYGAIWFTYYPNVMVEWYPHVLVISTVTPRGPEKCSNVVEFYYPEDIALFEREFIVAEQKAYGETAREDEEICMRMTLGRRALMMEGRDERGPYQSPMEDGMMHFHEFLRREMGPHL